MEKKPIARMQKSELHGHIIALSIKLDTLQIKYLDLEKEHCTSLKAALSSADSYRRLDEIIKTAKINMEAFMYAAFNEKLKRTSNDNYYSGPIPNDEEEEPDPMELMVKRWAHDLYNILKG